MVDSQMFCPRGHRTEPVMASERHLGPAGGPADDHVCAYWCDTCGKDFDPKQATTWDALRWCSAPGCTRALKVLEYPDCTIYQCDLHPELSRSVFH